MIATTPPDRISLHPLEEQDGQPFAALQAVTVIEIKILRAFAFKLKIQIQTNIPIKCVRMRTLYILYLKLYTLYRMYRIC